MLSLFWCHFSHSIHSTPIRRRFFISIISHNPFALSRWKLLLKGSSRNSRLSPENIPRALSAVDEAQVSGTYYHHRRLRAYSIHVLADVSVFRCFVFIFPLRDIKTLGPSNKYNYQQHGPETRSAGARARVRVRPPSPRIGPPRRRDSCGRGARTRPLATDAGVPPPRPPPPGAPQGRRRRQCAGYARRLLMTAVRCAVPSARRNRRRFTRRSQPEIPLMPILSFPLIRQTDSQRSVESTLPAVRTVPRRWVSAVVRSEEVFGHRHFRPRRSVELVPLRIILSTRARLSLKVFSILDFRSRRSVLSLSPSLSPNTTRFSISLTSDESAEGKPFTVYMPNYHSRLRFGGSSVPNAGEPSPIVFRPLARYVKYVKDGNKVADELQWTSFIAYDLCLAWVFADGTLHVLYRF